MTRVQSDKRPLRPIKPTLRLSSRPWLHLLIPLLTVPVGLAVVVSCTSAEEECLENEKIGVFIHNKNESCGCAKAKCENGKKCFQGDCCEPDVEMNNPKKCGCNEVCEDQEVCLNGACCDPFASSSATDCGCTGACEVRQKCEKGTDGRFSCVCDPDSSLGDANNCGCDGPCDSDWERCRDGKCECDPLAGANKTNNWDCACNGPCPFVELPDGEIEFTAYCYDGICHCIDANEVICDKACINQADCLCEPEKHKSDTYNCNCKGPCPSGEVCVNYSCECDPIAHATDNFNCGCQQISCNVAAGHICSQGNCSCPPERLSDNLNCGCTGPCDAAKGHMCIQGTCACPPERLSDNDNCGCKGPCISSLQPTCVGGDCVCPVSKQSDSNDCGCKGPCPKAPIVDVINGESIPWGEDHICDKGVCQCPYGTYLCNPPSNIDLQKVAVETNVCWPTGSNAIPSLCVNCATNCVQPKICGYSSNANDEITDVFCYTP